MFNENSGLVHIWVNLIETKNKTLSDVPNISNLREIVALVVNKETN